MSQRSKNLDELRKTSEAMLKELTGVSPSEGLLLPKNRDNDGLPCGPECHDAKSRFAERWQKFRDRHLYPFAIWENKELYPNPWAILALVAGLAAGIPLGMHYESFRLGAAVCGSALAIAPLIVALIGRVVSRRSVRAEAIRYHSHDDRVDLAHAAYLRQFSLAIDETESALLGNKSPIRRIQQTLDDRLKQATKTRDRLGHGLTDEKYAGRAASVQPAVSGMNRLIAKIDSHQGRAARHVREIEQVISGYRKEVEDISPVLADRLAIYAANALETETDHALADSAAQLDAALDAARQRIAELGHQKDYYLSKAVAAVHAAAGTEEDEHLGSMLDCALRTLPVPALTPTSAVEPTTADESVGSLAPVAIKT